MGRLGMQLRKRRGGLGNSLTGVDEALRERRGEIDLGDLIQVCCEADHSAVVVVAAAVGSAPFSWCSPAGIELV
jgi:hypothetical protein